MIHSPIVPAYILEAYLLDTSVGSPVSCQFPFLYQTANAIRHLNRGTRTNSDSCKLSDGDQGLREELVVR